MVCLREHICGKNSMYRNKSSLADDHQPKVSYWVYAVRWIWGPTNCFKEKRKKEYLAVFNAKFPSNRKESGSSEYQGLTHINTF